MRDVPRTEEALQRAVEIPVELGELQREPGLVVAKHLPHRVVEAGLDEVCDARLLVVELLTAQVEGASQSPQPVVDFGYRTGGVVDTPDFRLEIEADARREQLRRRFRALVKHDVGLIEDGAE